MIYAPWFLSVQDYSSEMPQYCTVPDFDVSVNFIFSDTVRG